MGIIECSFLQCLKCQAFNFISSSNDRETLKKCLFVVVLYLTLIFLNFKNIVNFDKLVDESH